MNWLRAAAVGALVGGLIVAGIVVHAGPKTAPEPQQGPSQKAIVIHTQKVEREASTASSNRQRVQRQTSVTETFHENGTVASRTRVVTREKESQRTRVAVRRDLVATSEVTATATASGTAPKALGLGAGVLMTQKGVGVSVTAEVLTVGPVQVKAGAGVINPQQPAPVGVLGVGAEVGPRMNLGVVGVVGVDGAGPWAQPGVVLEHRF